MWLFILSGGGQVAMTLDVILSDGEVVMTLDRGGQLS